MALLFLKQKLFPTKGKQPRPDTYGKPLLSASDSDTLDSDMDQDIEAQRSYRTFHTPRADSDSVSSGSSTPRSRINPRIISDAILGLSDGLTVPFALSAGLSALGNTKVVVLDSPSWQLEPSPWVWVDTSEPRVRQSYQTTVRETKELIETSPAETSTIVRDTFSAYDLPEAAISQINASLHASHDRLLDFLISFHHKETQPDCNQAWISAITLALGYFVGGFIPLIPYFMVDQVIVALYWSIGVMAVTLFAFGYIKTSVVRGWSGRDNIIAGIKGGVQMCFVGGVAAGAAIALVRLIDHGSA
ncbi:hypothetical protein KXW48_007314 [Aspergillus fumigatus]|nr:hypothetical protein KXW48_007314 [Aspergillus fumigatus]